MAILLLLPVVVVGMPPQGMLLLLPDASHGEPAAGGDVFRGC
jgi:hypothetical protein